MNAVQRYQRRGHAVDVVTTLHTRSLSLRSYAFSLRDHGVHGVLTECPQRSWSPHSIATALSRRSHCVLLRTQSHCVAFARALRITMCAQSQGVLGVPKVLCCVVTALSLPCHYVVCNPTAFTSAFGQISQSHCVHLGVRTNFATQWERRPSVTGVVETQHLSHLKRFSGIFRFDSVPARSDNAVGTPLV